MVDVSEGRLLDLHSEQALFWSPTAELALDASLVHGT